MYKVLIHGIKIINKIKLNVLHHDLLYTILRKLQQIYLTIVTQVYNVIVVICIDIQSNVVVVHVRNYFFECMEIV